MSRERILVAGAPKSGKTRGWLTIARLLPKCTFWVIDPDDGAQRIWKADFPDVKNINYYFTPFWSRKIESMPLDDGLQGTGRYGGVDDALTEIASKCKKGDWIVIEALFALWEMAQSEFVRRVFHEDMGDYFLRAREMMLSDAKTLQALKGDKDWQVINKMHNDDFMTKACFQLPCHVYATTSLSIIEKKETEKEEAEIKAFYGDTLLRLDGQKRNPFRFQSIFTFTHYTDKWAYSTFLGDRGRISVKNEQLFDFALQYLCGVAGWKV